MERPLTDEVDDRHAGPSADPGQQATDSTRLDPNSESSPPNITVFKVSTLRGLIAISVFAIVCQIIQLTCQVALIMQSKRLSMSAVSAVLVVWTVLALTLSAQWVILLSRNQIDIVKKGKLVACGSQGLAILSLMASIILVLIQNDDIKWKDDNTQFLVSAIVSCNALGVLIYSIIFTFILRGQRNVHQVIGSWLWLAIQTHIQRQQLLIEEGGNYNLKEHLQSAYNAQKLHFTAEAA